MSDKVVSSTAKIEPGARVKTPEGEGVVRAVVPARRLYPEKVLYKVKDRRGPDDRKDYKYGEDEVVYQVVLDAQPVYEDGPRVGQPKFRDGRATNFPQDKVAPC